MTTEDSKHPPMLRTGMGEEVDKQELELPTRVQICAPTKSVVY